MNILVINGSPKKKGGASAFFSKILGFMLFPHKVIVRAVGMSRNYEDIFACLQDMDAVILSVPLYVDSIPSHFIRFLKQMEEYCVNNTCKFMLYAISNAGFIEGRTNKPHLEQYKCWCQRANITWGGGLGIGGAVMLHIVSFVILLWSIIQLAIGVVINVVNGNPAIHNGTLTGFCHTMLFLLFYTSGLFFCTFLFARAIKRKKTIKNWYTRAMVPSFLFLIFADIFMALNALFHGKLIFSLYKRIKIDKEKKM